MHVDISSAAAKSDGHQLSRPTNIASGSAAEPTNAAFIVMLQQPMISQTTS